MTEWFGRKVFTGRRNSSNFILTVLWQLLDFIGVAFHLIMERRSICWILFMIANLHLRLLFFCSVKLILFRSFLCCTKSLQWHGQITSNNFLVLPISMFIPRSKKDQYLSVSSENFQPFTLKLRRKKKS